MKKTIESTTDGNRSQPEYIGIMKMETGLPALFSGTAVYKKAPES